ncbi:MAG TPA: cell division protein ZapA [bacterium]|nr:cell division protein ZapA [bacterium]HQO34229.1 cell division protein ZapA [bacterium]HQP97155.1 cell division protein ZapA [bacterium]
MEPIEFSALGIRLRLASGDNPEVVHRIVEFVEKRIADVSQAAPNAQPLQVALLTALNIAEQMYKEREQERAEYVKAVDKVRLMLHSLE